MRRLFIDANIFIDAIDQSRRFSIESIALMDKLFDRIEEYRLCTSCDLITTIYYVIKKNLDNQSALEQIKRINGIVSIIEFGNHEVDEAITLMEKNKKYIDLEDTIQYVMARKERCDYIITNDQAFASGDIPVLSTKEALKELA